MSSGLLNTGRLIVTYLTGARGYAQSVARNHRSLSSLAELLVSEWLPTTPRSPALAVTRQRWHVTTPDRRLAAISTVAFARTPPRAAQMFLLKSRFDSAGCGRTARRQNGRAPPGG